LYNKLQLAKKYLQYYWKAGHGKGHGTHPPFIYDFIEHVLNDKKAYPAYRIAEQLKNSLLANHQILEVEDFGAGSVTGATSHRTISSITANAGKQKKIARLLYRIVKYYGCRNIIELGTSMGINIARQALANFEKLYLKNIRLLEGEFDSSYSAALQDMPLVDLLFIDGNHQYQPTINYFEKALPHLHSSSIVIFDDIHWSAGMEDAWKHIKQHKAISESVDLFDIGIVFLREEQKAKQDFIIRF
jgi:predicted O-methyltransferase YrrM